MSLAQFHEVSLPAPLALAASGGPERRVEVVPLTGGREARNAVWAGSRRRWDIGTAVTTLDGLQVLTAFFEARGGRLHGFRFRDRVDDRSCTPGAVPSMLDQVIGVGDGNRTFFELTKAYGDWRRRIWKPVAGSVSVAVDGVVAEVDVDATLGTVLLTAAPPEGAVVTAGFLFDCPVRFDTDRLDINLETFGAGRVIRVPLIELVG
ncbi:MAG: TIGR02217 family protein [Hyphomonas sp.]